MGKILVKQQSAAAAPPGSVDPALFGASSPTQIFTGGAGLQSIIDPSRPEIGFPFRSGPTQTATLGTHPTHFIHPDSGQVLEHPLAGQPIVNPEAGQQLYTPAQRRAMMAARGLGAGLGAYSALMSFANDDDQDALTSALNALGSGYTTYASTAPLERTIGDVSERARGKRRGQLIADMGADAMPVHGPAPNLNPAPPRRRGNVGVTEVPTSNHTFYGTEDGLAELPSVDFIPKDTSKPTTELSEFDIPDVSPPPPPEELTEDEKKDIQRILDEYGFDFPEGGQFD